MQTYAKIIGVNYLFTSDAGIVLSVHLEKTKVLLVLHASFPWIFKGSHGRHAYDN